MAYNAGGIQGDPMPMFQMSDPVRMQQCEWRFLGPKNDLSRIGLFFSLFAPLFFLL
jgi:hypothetical protein